MKRLVVVVSLAAALAAIPVFSAASAEEGGNSANRTCKWLEERAPALFDRLYDSHGDCVSAFRAEDAPAKFCRDHYDLFWKNVGDCVSFFRTL
jgi:hypothetical protein